MLPSLRDNTGCLPNVSGVNVFFKNERAQNQSNERSTSILVWNCEVSPNYNTVCRLQIKNRTVLLSTGLLHKNIALRRETYECLKSDSFFVARRQSREGASSSVIRQIPRDTIAANTHSFGGTFAQIWARFFAANCFRRVS